MKRDVIAKPPMPRKAATVMLLREGDHGMEVFMIVRHQNSDVHAGALVFPGGRVDDEDYDLAADAAVFPPLSGVDAGMAVSVPDQRLQRAASLHPVACKQRC